MTKDNKTIAVVGGGLVGLVAALAVARTISSDNAQVVLVAPRSDSADKRTTAILMPTVEMLNRLQAWDGLEAVSAALTTMRIIDASGRLITAPPVDFRSSEIGQDAFGYNVPNEAAAEVLRGALSKQSNVSIVEATVTDCDPVSGLLTFDKRADLSADLIIAADGRNSVVRQTAGIDTRAWSYPQTALVTSFSHTMPHGDVSTELHTRTGPITQVPLPARGGAKYRSSLVWVVAPNEADQLLDWDRQHLSSKIECKLQSCLGKVTVEEDLQAFPLSGMTARKFATQKVFLVGEAAHVMPPIGAQGFNLGANDVDCLCKLLAGGASAENLSTHYNRQRRGEVLTKTGGIDLLNRSLLSGFLPLHLGRSVALGALSESSALRKLLMTGVMNGPGSLFSREKDQVAEYRS